MTDPQQATPESRSLVSDVTDSIDFHAYWRTLMRRRWLAIPFFLGVLLVTGIYTLRQTKIYDATCTIIIDLAAPKVLDKDSVQEVVESGSGSFWYSKEFYETQYKVLASRTVAQRVVDKLQLGQNLRFLGLDKVTDPAELERFKARADPAAVLTRSLKLQPVKDSRIVRITYESDDPQLAALIANTLAEAYIAENLSVKTVTTQNAAEWLETQLADLEKKLDDSGKALFEFKQSHDIVATTWEDRQSMVTQRLNQINDALTRARVRRAELQARNDAIQAVAQRFEKAGADVEALQPVATSMAIQQIKLRYLEARAECADLRSKYGEDHPRLKACDKRLAETLQGLRDEIKTALKAARQEYQETHEDREQPAGPAQRDQDRGLRPQPVRARLPGAEAQLRQQPAALRAGAEAAQGHRGLRHAAGLQRADPGPGAAGQPAGAAEPRQEHGAGAAARPAGRGRPGLRRRGARPVDHHPAAGRGAARAHLPGHHPHHREDQGRLGAGPGGPRPAQERGGRVPAGGAHQPALHVAGAAAQDHHGHLLRAAGGQDHHRHLAGHHHGRQRQPGAAGGRRHAQAAGAQDLRAGDPGRAVVADPGRGEARRRSRSPPRCRGSTCSPAGRCRPTRPSCCTPPPSSGCWRRWRPATTGSSSTRRRWAWWPTRWWWAPRWTACWWC